MLCRTVGHTRTLSRLWMWRETMSPAAEMTADCRLKRSTWVNERQRDTKYLCDEGCPSEAWYYLITEREIPVQWKFCIRPAGIQKAPINDMSKWTDFHAPSHFSFNSHLWRRTHSSNMTQQRHQWAYIPIIQNGTCSLIFSAALF